MGPSLIGNTRKGHASVFDDEAVRARKISISVHPVTEGPASLHLRVCIFKAAAVTESGKS